MDKSIKFDDVADIYDYYVTTDMDIGCMIYLLTKTVHSDA